MSSDKVKVGLLMQSMYGANNNADYTGVAGKVWGMRLWVVVRERTKKREGKGRQGSVKRSKCTRLTTELVVPYWNGVIL